MRFHKRNDQNERIALMFLDEVACVFLKKLWPRQLDRQIADGYLREPSIRFVRNDAIREKKLRVVPFTIRRNVMLESASDRPVLAKVPFADVSGSIILIVHELRKNAKPPIERHAIPRAAIDVRPRSRHER